MVNTSVNTGPLYGESGINPPRRMSYAPAEKVAFSINLAELKKGPVTMEIGGLKSASDDVIGNPRNRRPARLNSHLPTHRQTPASIPSGCESSRRIWRWPGAARFTWTMQRDSQSQVGPGKIQMTHSICIEQGAAMLSNTQITEYHQDGYTVCPNFLTPDEVAQLLAETEKIISGSTLANHDKDRLEMEPNQPPDGVKVRRAFMNRAVITRCSGRYPSPKNCWTLWRI